MTSSWYHCYFLTKNVLSSFLILSDNLLFSIHPHEASSAVNVFPVFTFNEAPWNPAWNTRKFSLHQFSRILSLWSRCNHFCKPVLLMFEAELPLDTFVFGLKIKGWNTFNKHKVLLKGYKWWRRFALHVFTTSFTAKPSSSFFLPLT